MSTKKLQIVNRVVSTDTTLTQSGIAADAKVVGEALAGKQPVGDYALKSELENLSTNVTEQISNAVEAIVPEDIGAADTDHTHDEYALKTEIPTVPVQSVNGKTGAVELSPADIGADPAGTTSTHNTATDAHNDIRLLIEGLTTRLNTLADSDDTTLDQMSEIVAYIKSNKSLIEDVTTNKVNVADIIDNLTTNVANKPLSAAQGVALKGLIDELQTAVNGKANSSDLTAHTGNTFNPHSVTKAQIGLDNVENKSSVTIRDEITSDNITAALGYTPASESHAHSNYADANHTHTYSEVGAAAADHTHDLSTANVNYAETAGAVAWGNVTDKPSTYAPDTHSHAISDVTDLQAELDALNSLNIQNGDGDLSVIANSTNKAIGTGAFAEGVTSSAIGNYAHAEGTSLAFGIASHSEGYASVEEIVISGSGLTYTVSSGNPSVGEIIVYNDKFAVITNRNYSSGTNITTDSILSDIELTNETVYCYSGAAIGNYSHVGGMSNLAYGHNSFAHGYNLISNRSNTFTIGKYNLDDETRDYIIIESTSSKRYNPNNSYKNITYTEPTYDEETHTFIYSGLRSMYPPLDGCYVKSSNTSYYYLETYTGRDSSNYYTYDAIYRSIKKGVDVDSTYLFTIGNGSSDYARSNAHTVDQNGNAWYQGDIYVGGTSQNDTNAIKLLPSKLVATETTPTANDMICWTYE